MASLGLEFLRFLDGREREWIQREGATRHHDLMDRIVRAAVVATNRYDEKQAFADYFPPSTPEGDVDYEQVKWDKNVDFEVPSEDEMAIIQRMMQDNSVTVVGSSFIQPSRTTNLPPALPDDYPAIEQIETDREWV